MGEWCGRDMVIEQKRECLITLIPLKYPPSPAILLWDLQPWWSFKTPLEM